MDWWRDPRSLLNMRKTVHSILILWYGVSRLSEDLRVASSKLALSAMTRGSSDGRAAGSILGQQHYHKFKIYVDTKDKIVYKKFTGTEI